MPKNKGNRIKAGGAYVGGNVNTGGGKFVGRDDYSQVEFLSKPNRRSNAKTQNFSIIKSLIVGAICILVFELFVYLLPWIWLITHPNSYGLQLAIDVLLLLSAFTFFIVKWRKYLLRSMLIPVFGFLLALLNGSK